MRIDNLVVASFSFVKTTANVVDIPDDLADEYAMGKLALYDVCFNTLSKINQGQVPIYYPELVNAISITLQKTRLVTRLFAITGTLLVIYSLASAIYRTWKQNQQPGEKEKSLPATAKKIALSPFFWTGLAALGLATHWQVKFVRPYAFLVSSLEAALPQGRDRVLEVASLAIQVILKLQPRSVFGKLATKASKSLNLPRAVLLFQSNLPSLAPKLVNQLDMLQLNNMAHPDLQPVVRNEAAG